MRRIIAAGSAAFLAACGAQAGADDAGPDGTAAAPSEASAAARPTVPDPAGCPARAPVDAELRPRSEAIPVPAVLRETMRSTVDNFAFVTFDGATLCLDASWMDSIDNPALSPDRRFASFDWQGYEAFGHLIVDRSGKGSTVDTGVQPVPSPSGRLLVAADLSESGYGALNGFAIWRIEPAGLRQLARQQMVPPATDWRIEGWAGETCVDLTAILWDGYTGEADAPRERFRASDGQGWQLEPGRCSGA